MAITDADILDVIRKLRLNLAALDNNHHLMNMLFTLDDQAIILEAKSIQPDIAALAQRLSVLLRNIEATKSFKLMVKNYNIQEEEDNAPD